MSEIKFEKYVPVSKHAQPHKMAVDQIVTRKNNPQYLNQIKSKMTKAMAEHKMEFSIFEGAKEYSIRRDK